MSDIKSLQLKMLTTYTGDEINRLIDSITTYNAKESKELQQQYQNLEHESSLSEDDKWSIQEGLIDQNTELKEVEELAYELAIIALYKKIEITTKRAIKIIYPDIDQKKLFYFKELKKKLKNKHIEIEAFTNYQAMNELRCLNNSIKHSHTVDDELANYAGWEKNKQLSGLKTAFIRLNPLCEQYLDEILNNFHKKYQELSNNASD